MISFIRCLLAIFYKDLLAEFRKREILNNVLFFSVLVIFLFSFAMGTDPALLKRLAPGLLWLAVLFSAVLTLERSFRAEVEEGCLDHLVLYAVSPRAVFLGKLFANFFFILVVQIAILFMMIFLYDLEWFKNPLLLGIVIVLGNLGVATLGTFYSALVTKMRARQVMLPLLLFPMLIPLLLACVYATHSALTGDVFKQSAAWIQMLFLFNVIFLPACLIAVGPVLED